jgi:riboflavin synthase
MVTDMALSSAAAKLDPSSLEQDMVDKARPHAKEVREGGKEGKRLTRERGSWGRKGLEGGKGGRSKVGGRTERWGKREREGVSSAL